MEPEEVGRLARQIVQKARAAVASYLKVAAPNPSQQAELAAYAICLAKLDVVFRAQRLDPQFQQADSDDVQDLVALLSIVPFDALLHGKVMLLTGCLRQRGEESLIFSWVILFANCSIRASALACPLSRIA